MWLTVIGHEATFKWIISFTDTLRLGKVTSVLADGIWVGFELTLGLKKTAENNPKIDSSCV